MTGDRPDQSLDHTVVDWTNHAWLLAALARHLHGTALGDGLSSPVDDAATAALEAAGVPLDELGPEDAAIRARALRSVLAQLVALSDASAVPSWGELDDGTLLAQGRASGGLSRMLLVPEGPFPDAMVERLGEPDAVFLDVGVGVGAISATLCGAFPTLRCVGLDILPRALELAEQELATRGVRDRVELRLQDVQDLDDEDAFSNAWIPLPLLPEDVARIAVGRVATALRPGGWLLVAAGREQPDPLRHAIDRLRAATVGGCPAHEADVREWLADAGFVDVAPVPMPPAAPHLLTARTPS
jgi:2-polyprenyl-3-methyl-5-hydroxy-6-metoxy-1,4-benzoquinol methylase